MKILKQITFTFLIISGLLTSLSSQAKIWRVNRLNSPPELSTAQAAHDIASPGDTIYLEPATTSYGDIILTKKLIIIGTGYFLDQNPETQWRRIWPSYLGSVTFGTDGSSSSEYSQLMGVTCSGSLNVNVSYIFVKRNYIAGATTIANPTGYLFDIIFINNWCGDSFIMSGNIQNVIINNNFFELTANNYSYAINGSGTCHGSFKNNIIWGNANPWQYYNEPDYLSVYNFDIQNNITYHIFFNPHNNDYSYNISDNEIFGNQNGNQENVDLSTVFLFTGSKDGQFQLKEGSPAIGAGAAGVDCGIFGGAFPYIFSGMPPIPAIYDFNIGQSGNQINVNMKVKAHN